MLFLRVFILFVGLTPGLFAGIRADEGMTTAKAKADAERALHEKKERARVRAAAPKLSIEANAQELRSPSQERRLPAIAQLSESKEGIELLAKRAEALVYDLGAKEYQSREDAAVRLQELGRFAIKALEEGMKSDNPDRQTRAKELRKRLEVPWTELAELMAQKADEEGEKLSQEASELLAAVLKNSKPEETRKMIKAIFSSRRRTDNQPQNELATLYKGILHRMGYKNIQDENTEASTSFSFSAPGKGKRVFKFIGDGVYVSREHVMKPQDLLSGQDPPHRLINGKTFDKTAPFSFTLLVPASLEKSLPIVSDEVFIQLKGYFKSIYPAEAEDIDDKAVRLFPNAPPP